jgi:MFS family permease
MTTSAVSVTSPAPHTTQPEPAISIPDVAYPNRHYGWYVMAVLFLANLCCYLARMVIILLIEPISHAIHITDTQISLLQGAAFSIFFVLCGLPLGWLVDRRGRRNIILAAVVAWSVMAILCGLSTNYPQLFLSRTGLGIGEAALTPAALSLIADYFPPVRRGRAMSIFYMGAVIGSGAATTIGALILRRLDGGLQLPFLQSLAPWQAMFVLSGVPGILIAALLLTVHEPRRQETARAAPISTPIIAGISEPSVLRFMSARWRAFLPVLASTSLMQLCGFAVLAWVIPLLVRRDHMSVPDAGATYGVVLVAVGIPAATVGGIISDRFARSRRSGGRLRGLLYSYVIFAPGVVVLSLALTPLFAIVGLMFEVCGVCMAASMMYTVMSDIVPNQLRGQAVAIVSMAATLVGATVGPTAVALATDRVFGDPLMIGYSILMVTLPCLAAGLALTLYGRPHYTMAQNELHGRA